MQRYKCARGKNTNLPKALKVCLIKQCPHLRVLQGSRGRRAQYLPILQDGGTPCI